jgi:hypothetical protein
MEPRSLTNGLGDLVLADELGIKRHLGEALRPCNTSARVPRAAQYAAPCKQLPHSNPRR